MEKKDNQHSKKTNHKNDVNINKQKQDLVSKEILDLKTLIDQYQKDLKSKDDIINNLNKQMEAYAKQYKDLALTIEQKANNKINEAINEYKTKLDKECEHFKKYAIEKDGLKIINLVLQLDRACSFPSNDEKINKFLSGFKIILTMANNLLNDLHITIIKPKIGEVFDPNVMECFELVKDASKKNDVVYSIIENGYKLHDHILKPALVKVVKNN